MLVAGEHADGDSARHKELLGFGGGFRCRNRIAAHDPRHTSWPMSSPSAKHPYAVYAADRARAAIEAGDTEAALAAVDEIVAEGMPMHNVMCDLTAFMLTYIGDKLGEEAVHDAWREAAELMWRPFFEKCKAKGDVDAYVKSFTAAVRSHRYEFDVIEDDEHWVVEVHRGTTGERMVLEGKVRDVEGGDQNGHRAFGVTREAHAWTYGLKNFPYYDVHCAVYFTLLPKELGWPVIDMEYGDKGGYQSEQRFIIYKDPAKRAAHLTEITG